MTTFDRIIPAVSEVLQGHKNALAASLKIYINRDLNGRVRIVADERMQAEPEIKGTLDKIASELHSRLGPHAFAPERMILWEHDPSSLFAGQSTLEINDVPSVRLVDRLATEGDWSKIAPVSLKTPRIVFYSIKGGVGRSTALAAVAWGFAEQGKSVLVVDLDLESPGLSTALLPDGQRPAFGVTDWLVEDLVDNSDAILPDMTALSPLSRNGDIRVIPAHGASAGEYIAKLGRVWMPKYDQGGAREEWPERLKRLLDALEDRWNPDIVLVDSRSGIDEVASACLAHLGAKLILLFSLDNSQNWEGYRIIFRHWHSAGVVQDIREHLQVVGALIPDMAGRDYFAGLLESAWTAFSEELYDEVPAEHEDPIGSSWNFDLSDDQAPHSPWPVRWHQGFQSLRNLHDHLGGLDRDQVTAIFGSLIGGINRVAPPKERLP
jgi:hypothetical protein